MSGASAKDLTELTTSIYEGADGYWHAKVPVRRRPDGTVERKHLKRRREDYLRGAVAALAAPPSDEPALPVVKRPEELTLAEWVDRWLNERLPLASRAHKTIYGYRSELNNHVLPALGTFRLHDINGELLERHFADLAQTKSLWTLNAAHRALSSAMADAIKARAYPGTNP